ncbi:MAG: TonB-dependent receptor [candidate division WOR-3 bacterium]|nr:MAG: TonB-dependent receptor [candidate division WOR-3 bacterium]
MTAARTLTVFWLLAASVAGAASFSGSVLDAYTRQPIPYADVAVHGTGVHLMAGKDGRFTAQTTGNTVGLTASRVGYRTRSWDRLEPAEGLMLYLFPEVIDLEGVTVSAFRYPVARSDAGPVTVVEPGDRVAGGANDISDLLRTTPTAFGRDNTNFTSISIRGTNANHSLVTLDGVKLNSAQNGTFDLTSLPAAIADRIEVARSGNSALYGTSAVGGLIDIITPSPGGMSANLRAGVGSFGRRFVELSHSNRVTPFGYVVAGHYSEADNDFPYPDTAGTRRTMADADEQNLSLFAKGETRTGPHLLSLLGEYGLNRRGSPGSRSFPTDSARRNDARGIGQFSYQLQPSDRLLTDLKLFLHRFWQNYQNPAGFAPVNDTHLLSSVGVQASQTWHPAHWARLIAGVEADRQSLASTSIGEPARTTLAVWAQSRAGFRGFGLTPMVRAEQLVQELHSDSGATRTTTQVLSPRVTLTWSGPGWLGAFTGVGRSFRAPTFNDLFWPEDAFTYGNPWLRPEWSTNLDIGVGGEHRGILDWWLGWYWSSLTDLIQWQPDSAGRWRPVNIDTAVITGVELEAALDLDFAGADVGLNWTRATSRGERLYYRPEFIARAELWAGQSLEQMTGRITLGIEHTGDRLTDPAWPDTIPATMPAYTLFDCGIRLGPKLRTADAALELGVRNVLDTRYQTVQDFPVQGRNWYLEFSLGL